MLALALGVPAAALPGPAPASPPLVAPPSADAAARAAVAGLPRATAVNDGDGDRLFDDLEVAYAAAGGATLPVVVSFVVGTDSSAALERLAPIAPGAAEGTPFTIIPGAALRLSAAEAEQVAALPDVRQIELDRPGAPELETATEIMGADAVVDGRLCFTPLPGVPPSCAPLGIEGSADDDPLVVSTQDIGIAVFDTGIDAGHNELASKLVAWTDHDRGEPVAYDPDGHGTHVASIAAGRGSVLAQRGVAPGASLYAVRIATSDGTTYSKAILAYETAVARKTELGLRVTTMSFGFGRATDGTTAMERAVDAAWDAGLVNVKSTGNSGPNPTTVTVPGAARGILAVGNILDPRGAAPGSSSGYGFTLHESSSRGPTTDGRIKPDLVAPGTEIVAAARGTGYGTVSFTGTSMAAPFVAGTAALVIDARPSVTPDEVREILFSTAEDFGATGPDTAFGHGRVRVLDAVMRALRLPPSAVAGPVVPRHEGGTATIPPTYVEREFTVTDARFPVGITVTGTGIVGFVQVLDPAGNPQIPPAASANLDLHHNVSFLPVAGTTYRLRVVGRVGAQMTYAISHSATGG